MISPPTEAAAFSKGVDREGDIGTERERTDRHAKYPNKNKRSILHSRFHIKLIATYLTPILLLPLFVFHNTPKTRCAYVMVLVFINWVTRTLPLGVTALMPLLYLPALRIISYDKVVGIYMNNTVLLTLAAIMMSISIETTNLHTRIALWVLLRCGQSLRNIMAGYTAATFLITLLLKNSATLDIMVPVVDATVHEIHYIHMKDMYTQRFGSDTKKKPSVSYIAKALSLDDIHMRRITTRFIKIRKVLLITVAYTASLGSVGTLSGTITNYVTKMIVMSRFPKVDSVTFLSWMTAFLPVAFFEVLMAFIVLYFMHMRRLATDFRKEAIRDAFLVKYRSLGNVTSAEKVVMVVLAVVFFLWSTRKAVFFKGWAHWLHMSEVDDTSVAFMAVAVLFAVPMSRDNLEKRILSWSVVKHKMAWGMLLTFGGGLALGIASEITHLSSEFVVLIEHLNIRTPLQMQVLISLIAALLTEFTPNDAAATMLLPVVMSLACKLKLNPLYLVFPVCLSVTQACIFPASSSVIAIICDEGHVNTKDLLIPGIIVKLFCQIVNLAFINTLGEYVFNLNTFPQWAYACFSSAPAIGDIPH